MLTDERIEALTKLGFKRWTKGEYDRLYIDASDLGLSCTYYNSGNIRSAEFRGEPISNSRARGLKFAKTYIDIKTSKVYSTIEMLADAAKDLAGIEED
jgi:hypothetical protein